MIQVSFNLLILQQLSLTNIFMVLYVHLKKHYKLANYAIYSIL